MDLFEYMSMQRKKEESPLAVRMRPKNLDEVVGQQHIIGTDFLWSSWNRKDNISKSNREYDECRFCADECNYFG